MDFRKIASNYSWSMTGELVNKAAFFFSNLYLAKVLLAENYGLFSLIQTTVLSLVMLVEISPLMFGIREVAKTNRPIAIARPIWGLRFFAGFLVCVIYVVGILLFDFDQGQRIAALSFVFYIIAYAIGTDWIHKGMEGFKWVAIGSLAQTCFYVPMLLSFVRDDGDLFLATFLWSVSYLVYSIVLYATLYKHSGMLIRPKIDIQAWKTNVKRSYHFFLNGILGVGYQFIPIFLLAHYGTWTDVGTFSVVYKSAFAVCGFAYYIPMAFYPQLSEYYKKDLKRFIVGVTRLRFILVSIAIVSTVGVFSMAGVFESFYSGSGYKGMRAVYELLTLLIPAYIIRYAYNIPLLSMGMQSVVTKQMFFASLISVILGIPLVMQMGAIGAAITVLAGETLVILIGMYYYYASIKSRILASAEHYGR